MADALFAFTIPTAGFQLARIIGKRRFFSVRLVSFSNVNHGCRYNNLCVAEWRWKCLSLSVAAIALPTATDTSFGVALSPAGKEVASTGAPQSEASAGGHNFLFLLLAGLGVDADAETTAGETVPGTKQMMTPTTTKKNDGLPGKAQSKEQPDDVTRVTPAAVLLAVAGLPVVTPQVSFDLQANGPDSPPVNSAQLQPNGTAPPIGRVASGYELVAKSSADSLADGPGGVPKPVQDGAAAASAPRGETAFEARIQVPAIDPGEEAVSTHPSTTPVMTIARPLSDEMRVSDARVSGRASPPKPASDRSVEPATDKVPATGETDGDLSGQDQQSAGDPGKGSGDVGRELPDEPPQTADSQNSAAAVSTVAILTGGGLTPSTSPKSQPQVAGPAHDATVELASPAHAPVPTRDIMLQLHDAGGARVDVQLADRGGTLQVVVRTQDDGLAKDLRTNLSDLTQRLNQQGMETDAWSPVEMHNTSGGHENSNHGHEQNSGDSQSSSGGQDSAGSDGKRHQRQYMNPDDEFDQNLSGLIAGDTTWQPAR